MYTANVPLRITQFVPLTTGNLPQSAFITAAILPPVNISPYPYNDPSIFTLTGDDQKIVVHTPVGYTGPVQLVFQLPNLEPAMPVRYVLQGLTFKPATGEPTTYPRLELQADNTGSQIAITDQITGDQSFEFWIIVQDRTNGAVGAIDPWIVNEPV